MKITSFQPMIISPKADALIELFEALGFEKKHTKTDIEGGQNTSVSMKNADGFKLDIASSEILPRDLTSIRMNVDDFDEAYEFLLSKGFVNTRGDKITETSSSKDTFMMSPSGFGITLVQHIK